MEGASGKRRTLLWAVTLSLRTLNLSDDKFAFGYHLGIFFYHTSLSCLHFLLSKLTKSNCDTLTQQLDYCDHWSQLCNQCTQCGHVECKSCEIDIQLYVELSILIFFYFLDTVIISLICDSGIGCWLRSRKLAMREAAQYEYGGGMVT
jgi:hypothetical protein